MTGCGMTYHGTVRSRYPAGGTAEKRKTKTAGAAGKAGKFQKPFILKKLFRETILGNSFLKLI